MKKQKGILIFTFTLIFFWNCKPEPSTKQYPTHPKWVNPNEVVVEEYQKLLDSMQLKGALLFFDSNDSVYYSNNFSKANERSLPASTYKIPNALIGLQTGTVNDSTVFKWDKKPRFFKSWEKDLSLEQAFKVSCLPCFQEMAEWIGYEKMKQFNDTLNFGKMDITPTNYSEFWIKGNSTITPMEQISFLQRLYRNDLPISVKNQEKVKNYMSIDTINSHKLKGKTGWAFSENLPDNVGWFVGWLEKEKPVYFATYVMPKDSMALQNFPKSRVLITKKALKEFLH